jgi:thioredoxin-like negative regulator of GroEL
MSDNVKEITAANFNQEVIESDIPVLVDFCKSSLNKSRIAEDTR